MDDKNSLTSFTESITGKVLIPGDPEFEAASHIWNSRLQATPAILVQCSDAKDVALAVKYAKRNDLTICVRSGGHSYAGHSSVENSLTIDLSSMKGIAIDVQHQMANVQAGVLWGEFYETCDGTGLAAAGGTVSSVGVAGFTLGGGSGYLTRKHGMAIDNVTGFEVVTADGQIIHVDEFREPELFWGLRGGGGNFGIVTEFEMKLHPVPSNMMAGQVIYPFSAANEVLRSFRDIMLSAPDELTCFPSFFRIPPIPVFPEELHGQVVICLVIAYVGEIEDAEKAVAPLRKIATPIVDTVGSQTYTQVNQMFDPGVPPGQRWYTKAIDMDELSDAAIEKTLEQAKTLTGPLTFAYLGAGGGAVARVASDATPYQARSSAFTFHVLAGWMEDKEDQGSVDWAKSFYQEMAPFSNGKVYVNLLAEDEADRVSEAYGDNLDRLRKLKSAWDPDNVFRNNNNITPG